MWEGLGRGEEDMGGAREGRCGYGRSYGGERWIWEELGRLGRGEVEFD